MVYTGYILCLVSDELGNPDDIGAILVIALFCSTGIDPVMLIGATVVVLLVLAAWFIGAQSITLYSTLGVEL